MIDCEKAKSLLILIDCEAVGKLVLWVEFEISNKPVHFRYIVRDTINRSFLIDCEFSRSRAWLRQVKNVLLENVVKVN